jgi:predicted nucleic acid-binding Zn ribbon protein
MTLTVLKCPNCGALIPRESLNCEYCGAILSLTPDKTTLLPQKTNNCPKCANPVASGAWFCAKCGEVLTKDVEHLKQIQKKVLFVQEDIKRKYPETSSLLEPNEFIYFLFHNKGLLTNKYYVATDKRLLVFNVRKKESGQALLSEIVTIGKPYFTGSAPFTHWFKVQSFKETFALDFGHDRASLSNTLQFHRALQKALDDYTLQKRDIRAILCSLKIP